MEKAKDFHILSYFAGLIDGEGHIGCQQYNGKPRPVIQLNMTDKETVQYFADYFDLKMRELKSPSHIEAYAKGHKQQYQVRAECHVAHNIIKQLYPYLLTKKQACVEPLAYYIGRKCVVCDTEISESMNARTKYCSANCRQKNKRITGSAQKAEKKKGGKH